MAKLTQRQKEIISIMREGWNIHYSKNNGLSMYKHGEEAKKINTWTFVSLNNKSIIDIVGIHGWTSKYGLTEFGKTCVLAD